MDRLRLVLIALLIFGAAVGMFLVQAPIAEFTDSIYVGMIGHAYAYTADYQCDGMDDYVQLEDGALDALPATGGKMIVMSGTYNTGQTIDRAIPNVTIEGAGRSTLLNYNGADAVISDSGQANWIICNLALDAGGLNLTGTGSKAYNVWIGGTHYDVWTSGTGDATVVLPNDSIGADEIAADTESELESLLGDVTDVFTNNDGALDDDNVTLTDVQTACSSDFHNIGGTDDDVPESGDFGGAADLDADGGISTDAVDDDEINWGTGVGQVSTDDVPQGSTNLYTADDLSDNNITDLANVNATSPSNDDVLSYNNTSGKWEPKAVSGTGDMQKSTYDTNADDDIDLGAGGTGESLTDPGADRALYWNNAGSNMTWLGFSSIFGISGYTLTIAADAINDTLIDWGSGTNQVNSDDVAEGSSNLYQTQERTEDYAGGMVEGNTETRITVTYNDTSGKLDFVVDDMNDDVPEAGDFGAAADLDANGEVLDNSHNHNSTTISDLDISDDTNLAASSPIALSDDTIGLNYTSPLTTSGINLTVQDASDSAKGAAQFNSTGFSVSSGLVSLNVTRSIFLSAAGIWPADPSPASNNTLVEYTTNNVSMYHIDYDNVTDEYVQVQTGLPLDFAADGHTNLTATFYWTCTGGGAGGTVVWAIQGIAYGNDDAIDIAWGTPVTVSDDWIANNDVHTTSATGEFALAGTGAPGELAQFRVYRDADNGSDDLGGDARLIMVRIDYHGR